MSKLYNQYIYLKQENKEQFYLFKSGVFYIFLEEDARYISSLFHLKCIPLNENVVKCGFPVNSYSKYQKLFEENGLNIQIIDDHPEILPFSEDLITFVNQIKTMDFANVTPLEIYHLVLELKEKLKNEWFRRPKNL